MLTAFLSYSLYALKNDADCPLNRVMHLSCFVDDFRSRLPPTAGGHNLIKNGFIGGGHKKAAVILSASRVGY